jgi:transcriptional regulator GlxA family with amidase domain
LGVSVTKVLPDVLDAFSRLVDMLDRPEHAPLRVPLLIREIIARILLGPQGYVLRTIYTLDSYSNKIFHAITWLRDNYTKPLHIENLASIVGLATSSFHHKFKNVTSLSPLQFQKCLRLYEAQRLMLTENMDANNAGRSVGYDSMQQFNREYKRMFGDPPYRDIKRLCKK